jgi:8-oxo-dGTP pyrophosphatase MutT (NUDIX family)
MDDHDAQELASDGAVTAIASASGLVPAPKAKDKKKKKKKKPLEERKVHEAGAIIVCDGMIVLRLSDKQRWIFPKGKLKKHESACDAAVREATEETGLEVEVVDQVADLLMRHEGKKRRFVFYLMRATAKTWDWPHHEGRDTFLMTPERVGQTVSQDGYGDVWAAAEPGVREILGEAPPVEEQAAESTGR